MIIAKTTSRESIENVMNEMKTTADTLFYRLSRHSFVNDIPTNVTTPIRWGVTASVTGVESAFNSASAIKMTSNKGYARRVLHEAGVPVPQPLDVRNSSIGDVPIVVRPNFHQKGRGWRVLNNDMELRAWKSTHRGQLDDYYMSLYYPKTTEWRVHVAHGKVLLVQQKLQTSDVGGETPLNWNHDSGYTFEPVRWTDYRLDLVKTAIKAIEAVGLDFGAVDLLADPCDDSLSSVAVCEINTAPKLEGYTAERYAEYFDWLHNTNEVRHFVIPEDTLPRHYVFKHRELQELDYDFGFDPICIGATPDDMLENETFMGYMRRYLNF